MVRTLGSFNRNRQKKRSLQAVLARDQHNKGIVNIHRVDTNNIGDFFCAPHLYFDQLRNTSLDIYDFKSTDPEVSANWIGQVSDNALIIGGGGLLNRGSFELQMKLFERLHELGKKTVLWGVGHNSKNPKEFGQVRSYNINTDNFGLAGVRDRDMKAEWVPCVSCMHGIFDATYDETQAVGLVFHKKTMKRKGLLNTLKDFPSTSNTTSLDDMIQFIGSSATVVTDSYHAMYWAMLLGKKVIAIPNSSKFFSFKYDPVISTFETFTADLAKARSYSGVLDECREINRNFASRVFDYLEIS